MNILIELSVIGVGLVLFFATRIFLPSYFNEKGKNLATKEDVESITATVEKIKSEFIKDIELIKADLTYTNQNKFSIKSAERDALIETNTKYAEWLNLLLNVSFADVNSSNYLKLNSYYADIKLKKLNFDVALSNLNLFLHDEELTLAQANCLVETGKLEQILMETISDMVNQFERESIYFQSIAQLEKSKLPDEDWLHKQRIASRKDRDAIFYKMIDEKKRQFPIAHERRVIFVKALKKRLFIITAEN